MKPFLHLVVALLLIPVLATPSQAQPKHRLDTTQVVTFGDSLTDNEFLFFLPEPFGNPLGPAVYGNDPMQAFLQKAAAPEDDLLSFAVLGSVSGTGQCEDPFTQTCGLLTQIDHYDQLLRQGAIHAATLVSIQAGGNDVLDLENNLANLFLLASSPPGTNGDADALMRQIRKNIHAGIKKIHRSNPHTQIVLWTVPDVTWTPLVLSLGLSAEQASNLSSHVEQTNRWIRNYSNRRNVILLDISQILTDNTFNPPVIDGVVIQPSISGQVGLPTNQFADPIHPTAVVNALLANALIDEVNSQFGSSIETYSESELADLAGIESGID